MWVSEARTRRTPHSKVLSGEFSKSKLHIFEWIQLHFKVLRVQIEYILKNKDWVHLENINWVFFFLCSHPVMYAYL